MKRNLNTFSVNLYESIFFSIGDTNIFVFPGQLIIITLKDNHLKGWDLGKSQVINFEEG